MNLENPNRNFVRCSLKEKVTNTNQETVTNREQENVTNTQVENGTKKKTFIASRNPLADLQGNTFSTITKYSSIRRSVSTATCIKHFEPRKRARLECRKFEKVTERQTYHEDVYADNVDEVFVDGQEHFSNYVSQNKQPKILKYSLPQIEQPLPVVRTAEEISRKPARKITLARRSSNRQHHPDANELFSNCLYDSEYFEESYRCMLTSEVEFVFRKDYLKKSIDANFRMVVVHWLSYAQQVLELTEIVFFATVRMLDYLLIRLETETCKYSLIGVVTLWIVNKYLGVRYVKVSKLYALCNGKFSRQEIITTENDILKTVNFNLNFPEPETFLYHYLRHENLENNEVLRNSAMFLLELFTLLLDFSSSLPSILAASALYIALIKHNRDSVGFVSYIDSHLLEEVIFKRFTHELDIKVKHLLDYPKISGEIVSKYSTPAKVCVARDFIR